MTWKNDLEIGVKTIDLQHKARCDAIDNLMNACKSGKGRNEIVSTFNFLFNYTQKHFREEEMQRKCGYPKCDEHKELHNAFIERLIQMKDYIIKNGINISKVGEVNAFLTSWLVKHIKRVDLELAQCIK